MNPFEIMFSKYERENTKLPNSLGEVSRLFLLDHDGTHRALAALIPWPRLVQRGEQVHAEGGVGGVAPGRDDHHRLRAEATATATCLCGRCVCVCVCVCVMWNEKSVHTSESQNMLNKLFSLSYSIFLL